jgi:hypothetical protein
MYQVRTMMTFYFTSLDLLYSILHLINYEHASTQTETQAKFIMDQQFIAQSFADGSN